MSVLEIVIYMHLTWKIDCYYRKLALYALAICNLAPFWPHDAFALAIWTSFALAMGTVAHCALAMGTVAYYRARPIWTLRAASFALAMGSVAHYCALAAFPLAIWTSFALAMGTRPYCFQAMWTLAASFAPAMGTVAHYRARAIWTLRVASFALAMGTVVHYRARAIWTLLADSFALAISRELAALVMVILTIGLKLVSDCSSLLKTSWLIAFLVLPRQLLFLHL